MKRYYVFLLGIICMNADVLAFETETHALITRQAYANSVLVQTGEGSVVNRLGLDRLDTTTPFTLYWANYWNGNDYYYNDGGLNQSISHPEYPEQCQMQELRTPPTPIQFRTLFENTVEASGSNSTLLPLQNWLVRGAIREDDLSDGYTFGASIPSGFKCYSNSADVGDIFRVSNHFYDPRQDIPLTPCYIDTCNKSVDWALGNIDSFATPPQVNDSRTNHYSYADARSMFWGALTRQYSRQAGQAYTGTQRELDAQDRLILWATTFRALGDVVHLLQDTAQPQHTRNDPHGPIITNGEQQAFEGFTNARVLGGSAAVNDYVKSFFGSSTETTLPAPSLGSYGTVMFSTPLKFFTSRVQGDDENTSPNNRYGLADYTNRGFFTGGTLPGAENNGYSEPPSTLDEANGYTAVSNTECAKQFGLDARLSAVACTHYTRAVSDTVNPTYQDELPNGYTWPHIPLVSDSIFRKIVLDYGITYLHETALAIDELQTIGNLTIPRAVGYSTGLLDYFFRGQLTLTAPPNGLFGVLDQGIPHTVDGDGYPRLGDGSMLGFTEVRVRVTNTTPALIESGSGISVPQSAKNGQLVAVARYHRNLCYRTDLSGELVRHSDGSQNVPAGCDSAASRSAYPEISVSAALSVDSNGNLSGPSNPNNACINSGSLNATGSNSCGDGSVLAAFDFSADPIPLNVTDLFVQVIYRGNLGDESDGIAVGTFDVMEPTYYSYWNNTDWYWHQNTWTDATALNNDSDYYPSELQRLYICFGSQFVYAIAPGLTLPVYPHEFSRFATLVDQQAHPLLAIYVLANNPNYYLYGMSTNMTGTRRQSDLEDGGTFSVDAMEYGRGVTLGALWKYVYQLDYDTSTVYPNGTSVLSLLPALSTASGVGYPVQGYYQYPGMSDPTCAQLNGASEVTDPAHSDDFSNAAEGGVED